MTYYGAKNLADSFRTVRKNTIVLAEEIPADNYDFRAAPGVDKAGGGLVSAHAAPVTTGVSASPPHSDHEPS